MLLPIRKIISVRLLFALTFAAVFCIASIIWAIADYQTLNCDLNQTVEVTHNDEILVEPNNLEMLHSKNIRQLDQLSRLRGSRQDITKSGPTFSPNGYYIAVGGGSSARDGSMMVENLCGNLWIWNLSSGNVEIKRISEKRSSVNFLVFSPDSTLLVSAESGNEKLIQTIRRWKVNGSVTQWYGQPSQLNEIVAQDLILDSYTVSPQGSLLALGDHQGNIYIWDILQQREIGIYRGSGETITNLMFDPTGTLLAIASSDVNEVSSVRFWDTQTNLWETIFNYTLGGFLVGFDGTKIYLVSEDKELQVWDRTASDTTLKVQLVDNQKQRFTNIAFSSEHSLFATVSGDGVSIWNIFTGERIYFLQNVPQFIARRLGFSPDGKLLAISGIDYSHHEGLAGTDAEVQIWGVPAQK